MKVEFSRYGLSKYRKLTGIFELLGGVGILIGLKISSIFMISTGGLSLLMFLGILARIKIKDKMINIVPAILFFTLSLYLLMAIER